LIVIDHVKVAAHGRAERNVMHDLRICREGVFLQQAQIGDHLIRRGELNGGNDPDFAQSEGDPLPQLVRSGSPIEKELLLYWANWRSAIAVRGNIRNG